MTHILPPHSAASGDETAACPASCGSVAPAAGRLCRFLPQNPAAPAAEWRAEQGLAAYPEAVAFMEERVAQIIAGQAPELVWLVEHPALYTAGTGAQAEDLLAPGRLPVYKTGRGGQFTYHGPGQRVIYIMLDLKRRKQDIRAFITAVEEWGIRTLADFGLQAERRSGRVGIWLTGEKNPALAASEAKIAAIGLRLRKWVSFHGMAVNIAPNLAHYNGIVPCGIKDYGVTSMAELGRAVSFAEWDAALKRNFHQIFGSTAAPA